MLRIRDEESNEMPASPVVASSHSGRAMQILALALAGALLLAMVAEVAGVFGANNFVLDLLVPIAALPLLALTLLLYRQRTALHADDARPSAIHSLPLPHVTHRSAPAPLSDPFAAA